jgi:hypothetical protein
MPRLSIPRTRWLVASALLAAALLTGFLLCRAAGLDEPSPVAAPAR